MTMAVALIHEVNFFAPSDRDWNSDLPSLFIDRIWVSIVVNALLISVYLPFVTCPDSSSFK